MANQVVENGVKLVGERILPGTSLMMDGDITGGLAHAAIGLLARAAFGPVAWFAVAADSYSRSVTGKGLIDRKRTANPIFPPPGWIFENTRQEVIHGAEAES